MLSALRQAILEKMKEALVHPLDGPEEFLDPHGFASYLFAGRGR